MTRVAGSRGEHHHREPGQGRLSKTQRVPGGSYTLVVADRMSMFMFIFMFPLHVEGSWFP
jgi:hypothetical protein